MSKILAGMRFHDWTVIGPTTSNAKSGTPYFLCRCQCGTEKAVSRSNLKGGQSKRCHACGRATTGERRQSPSKIGERFGFLVVVAEAARGNGAKRRWVCLCDCGEQTTVTQSDLVTETRSCFACAAKRRTKHGRSHSPEYVIWASMKQRCFNPREPGFKWYGGRGITVCDRWANDPAAFLEDMGPRPTPDHSIDRIDVDGNYEPSNCRWATLQEQSRNTRRNHYLTAFGETKLLADWGAAYGISGAAIYSRLKSGWTPEDAVSRPLDKATGRPRKAA